ncbi:Microtubule-associated protein 1A [Bienertia sinuspersici]
MMNKRNKKKNQKVLDDCCVDEVREKQEKKLVVDQTVEEKDNQVIVENQTAGEKDSQVIVEDQTVEEKDNQVIVKDQTVEEKDCQVIVEDQTVEEKDNQVIVEDQTAEIELKLKKVSVSGLNGRSTTEIGGKRREYGGYNRGYRRDYGKRSWEVRRERNVAVDGIPEFGRSMAKFEGWRGVHRGYSKGEDRGKTYSRKDEQIWVKKNDVCVESCGN